MVKISLFSKTIWLVLDLLPYVKKEDIETLACEIDVIKFDEEQGSPPKAIRNVILNQLGLSRPVQQRSLSDEARKMLFDVL